MAVLTALPRLHRRNIVFMLGFSLPGSELIDSQSVDCPDPCLVLARGEDIMPAHVEHSTREHPAYRSDFQTSSIICKVILQKWP